MPAHIVHHGAFKGVTGSCHQLFIDDVNSLLIDCGLFQGAETAPDGRAGAEQLEIGFAVDHLQVLVATHVPPFEENLVRKPGDLAWSIRNAYSGNLTLGRRIVQCPKVTHVISGHTHAGGRWRIQTPHGTVESYVVGSDYGRPACTVIDLPWISPV